jgi:hypothetical protein
VDIGGGSLKNFACTFVARNLKVHWSLRVSRNFGSASKPSISP